MQVYRKRRINQQNTGNAGKSIMEKSYILNGYYIELEEEDAIKLKNKGCVVIPVKAIQ